MTTDDTTTPTDADEQADTATGDGQATGDATPPTATDGGTATEDDDFEPVQVFPAPEEEMDLRPGADSCYKCTACDTSCPVAEVDDEFPGPKFQGPEQWRLKRKDDVEIDDSITDCSNCMRCGGACPSGVPLSQMHNTARAEYVENQMPKLSREYVRNRILANYGTLARFGALVPGLTNLVMSSSVTKWVNEKLLGITAEREFPPFADETFRSWWADRGGPAVTDAPPDKRIAYFHGDYANYNTPEVAKALVRVYESYGYEIRVPEQRCSGTPMFANGMLKDARRAAQVNCDSLSSLVADGFDIVASCTSCSMALREEYPELFDLDGVEDVATNTWDALEYLRVHEDLIGDLSEASVTVEDLAAVAPDVDAEDLRAASPAHPGGDGPGHDGAVAADGGRTADAAGVGAGADAPGSNGTEQAAFAYHAPCHARNQGLDGQAVELFRALDGVRVDDVGDSCSGISGTYGWKEEKYEKSMEIGEEMFEHMEAVPGQAGMTECPTCSSQMEHGTGYPIVHPLQVLEAALIG
jgi:glycerol-3-phosphate dehydrogenase subunit C